MSEVVKPNDKIINFDNPHLEVSPFDSKAAQKTREQRMTEYKAEHPEAVDDINKAYAMAKAGDKYETEAAKLRAQGNYDDARVVQKIANTVEEAAGEYYNKKNGKYDRAKKAS